jgi:hypothetical protein
MLWAAPLTSGIPLAVLAGIVLKVGISIIDWNFLQKLGIAGLIPEHYWMSDRLNALQEGLAIIHQKQAFSSYN